MKIRAIALGLAMIFATPVVKAFTPNEFCLALTAYTEARAEGAHGMALVAQTVINRAEDSGKSYCQVAYAPYQFDGVRRWPRGKNPATHEPEAWNTALTVVREVLDGAYDLGACTASRYFYSPSNMPNGSVPRWARVKPFLCRHKGHLFYGK